MSAKSSHTHPDVRRDFHQALYGFTLIELLVVVTIIVVLIALLAPALDQAIYQAELSICGSNLNAIGVGVTLYSGENRRLYPYRPTMDTQSGHQRVLAISEANGDDRPYLRNHVSLKALVDPLGGGIDLKAPPSLELVWSNYPLWWNVRYYVVSEGGGVQGFGKAIRRVGDRLEWTDRSRGLVRELRSSVLASDLDGVYTLNYEFASHPETVSKLLLGFYKVQQVRGQTASWWFGTGDSSREAQRNPIDLNYVYMDGSVRRRNDSEMRDDSLVRVPLYNKAFGVYEDNVEMWHQLPYEN